MIVLLEKVLTAEQLVVARDLMSKGQFLDGRESAGEQARSQKNNLELKLTTSLRDALNNLVMGALIKHPTYLNAGLPHRIASPYYSCYREGMSYGDHVDDPIMGQGNQYRSDVAITIFLNAPEDYEGGDLCIDTTFGRQRIKGKAGDGIMYPASSRHQVEMITRGERLAAVTWMQSLIPEPDRRDLLYQLYLAKESLREQQADSETTQRVNHSYVNLVRMWSRL